jgi:hypothetical protein
MDQSFKISLGVEELAACFMFAGRKDEGRGILKGISNEMGVDEERGRLIAASHSLIARGVLDSKNGNAYLINEVKDIVNGMLVSPRTFRASKTVTGGEAIVAFYEFAGGWIEHRVIDEVIHNFCFLAQKDEIYEAVEQFFSPVCLSNHTFEVILLPNDFFKLDSKERRSYDSILNKIRQASPNHSGAEILARDMAQAQWRGNFLRLEVATQKDDLNAKSVFWVQGSDKLWGIFADGNDSQNIKLMARVENMTEFQAGIKGLVA